MRLELISQFQPANDRFKTIKLTHGFCFSTERRYFCRDKSSISFEPNVPYITSYFEKAGFIKVHYE